MIKGCLGVIKPSDSKYDLDLKRTEKLNLEGLKSVVSKSSASKIWWGVSEVRFKKLDSFILEMSKNHLIRNFLRNGRVRVKYNELDLREKLFSSLNLQKNSMIPEKKRLIKSHNHFEISTCYILWVSGSEQWLPDIFSWFFEELNYNGRQ